MPHPPPSPFPLSHHERFQDETLLFNTRPFSPGLVDLGEDEEWGTSFGAVDSPAGTPRDIDQANALENVFERELYTGHGEKVTAPCAPIPPTPPPLPPTARLLTPKDESTALARYLAKHRKKQMDVFETTSQTPAVQDLDATADTIEPTISARATPVRMGTVEELKIVQEAATPLVATYSAVEDTPRRSRRVQRLASEHGPMRASPRRRKLSPDPSSLMLLDEISAPVEQVPRRARSTGHKRTEHAIIAETSQQETPFLPEPTLQSSALPGRWPQASTSATILEEQAVRPSTMETSAVPTPSPQPHLEPAKAASPPRPPVQPTPPSVYPELPERENGTTQNSRRKSLTATVQTFFAGLVGRSASPASTSVSTPTSVPLAEQEAERPVVATTSLDEAINHKPARVELTKRDAAPTASRRVAAESSHRLDSKVEKRKRRDDEPPRVTRIRLFGPDDQVEKSSRSVKTIKRDHASHRPTALTRHVAAPPVVKDKKPALPKPTSATAPSAPVESIRRPWREAAHALGAPKAASRPIAALPKQVAPVPRPVKTPAPRSAPLQLTKPQPFTFAAPRVAPVAAVADRGPVSVKPHERATNIAARRAVFENLTKRPAPKVTVPEVGRTPGRIIRQRIEERQKFELGLRQREEEKRKVREEADAERMRLEAAEDAQRRKETIIWAHPVPDMYRRPQNAGD